MSDGAASLERALTAARGLKPGTWESVEALAIASMTAGHPESTQLLELARATAARLKAGTWEAVRALAWLSRAEREHPGP